jgi:hypothetical protein
VKETIVPYDMRQLAVAARAHRNKNCNENFQRLILRNIVDKIGKIMPHILPAQILCCLIERWFKNQEKP